ncbi:heme-degrading domain-containing protein [Vibrio sp. SA48]|uniref:heme-degrading domain-containing protein n=1 Tax=Vibrio sp. S12_S33 TaxID=2720223 RepID=UPI0017840C96|nr:heme-degrading domain-containing protein [Vibrio sp. S12_S33]MBD1564682.1 heme-degrading domain-containing protein [Vibrio sp. S12_S33]
MITDLNQLLAQEAELQFNEFDNQTAWELGSLIKNRAEAKQVNVAIEIVCNGHRLFSFAMPDTTCDNQCWIERKRNVVDRYQHSSWYMGQYYKAKGKTIDQASLVDAKEFAPYGGSFPLIIRGVGVVGSISVSGLPQYEDHKLVVDTIADYLAGEKA